RGEKKNIYIFHFDDPIDQSYILKENFWSSEGAFFVFDIWRPNTVLRPLFTRGTRLVIDKGITTGNHAKFPMNIRLRICIDPWRPLLAGCFVRVGEGRRIWIQFIYKRVFRICKNCRRIRHTYPSCGVDNLDIERELNSQLDNIRHIFGYDIGMDVQEVHFVNEMCAFLHRSDRRATRVYYC
ncbi:hypothetical protein ERO13_D03G097350v2, partial [Gossypium hirsutum]